MPQTDKTEVYETTTASDDSAHTTRSVTQESNLSGVMIAQRVIWFIVGVIDVLLAIRFILLLLGANQATAFVNLIYGITSPFVAPFVGIFGQPTYGSFTFEWSSLLAIAVYSLVAWGIAKLLTLSRPREEI